MPSVLQHKRAGAVLVLLCFFATGVRAQTAAVRGFVTDAANGQPLELVNIILSGAEGSARGAATNADGLYLIPRLAPGRYTFTASFIGYETFIDTLDLAPGEVRTMNVALSPDEAALDEVLVESERTSGAARVTAGQQTIRPAEIELVPMPDAAGDLAAYLTTLPGVVSTADRGGQLFIRGGEPSQNLVLLDGMTLYQPFHLLGFYSAFPSDILSRADVYAGGFGARFGGRLSSVIDVRTRGGNDRRFAGAVSLSPFVSAARLEGPILPGRASFLFSGRQSVLSYGIEDVIGRTLPFTFGDLFGKLQGQISANSRGAITAIRTYDRGTLAEGEDGLPGEALRWQNRGLALRYMILPRILPVTADVHLTFSGLETELGPAEAPVRSSAVENTELSIDATFVGGRMDVDAGIGVQLLTVESMLGGAYQNVQNQTAQLDLISYYLEPEIELGRGLRLRPGVRLQFTASRLDPMLEPRLRLVWARGAHQVSGATGLYHQEVVGLSDRRDAASIFTAWAAIPTAAPRGEDVRVGRIPRAVHTLLGYRVTPRAWLELSVEGFYKDLSNLFVAEWTAYPRFTTRLQPADGRSLGLDARVEVRRARFYGYVSYGLSSTRYEARQAALALWYGTETLHFRPPHDRRHQVSALASGRLLGFEVSARWQFGSGLPYSRALGFDSFILMDGLVDLAQPGSRRVLYERPYNALLPTYHRLDLSVEHTFPLKRAALTLMGSLINSYDRRNLFYLDLFTLRRTDQLPLVPSLGIKAAFE